MTTDTGEPPSPGQQAASPDSSSYRPSHPEKPWRPASFLASFGHARDGVVATFRLERNFRFHVFAAVLVLIAGLVLHLSPLRIAAVFLAIALVMVTELFNTAIEAAVDLAMPEYHLLAKRAKDASAGAVLIAAVCAAVVGALVFLPALIPYAKKLPGSAVILPGALLCAAIGFALVRNRRRANTPGSSSDLSRKLVIGVALLAFAATEAHCFKAAMGRALTDPEKSGITCYIPPDNRDPAFYPALPFSAGVP